MNHEQAEIAIRLLGEIAKDLSLLRMKGEQKKSRQCIHCRESRRRGFSGEGCGHCRGTGIEWYD